MGRRGPEPDHAKREAFARLIREGVPLQRASRMVGIHPRTGKRWRNGRRILSGGHVVDVPPVITPVALIVNRYSPRDLSEDERVRLADLRREGRPRAGRMGHAHRPRTRWAGAVGRGDPRCSAGRGRLGTGHALVDPDIEIRVGSEPRWCDGDPATHRA